MKKEYFKNLVDSYAYLLPLGKKETEQVLRSLAQNYGGCISCCYSYAHHSAEKNKQNAWLLRNCQLGLNQNICNMHTKFPNTKTEKEVIK